MTQVQILATGGALPLYVARPAAQPTAAIIVVPEIFGVNAGIRAKCDQWAKQGYLAVAPDIFWRFAPGIQLDPDIEAEFQQALGYFGQYDADDGAADIAATLNWLRDQQIAKVGLVGFCLGGRLAYMAACRTSVDAAVGYYGVMIDTMLAESAQITRPLMLHIPTADHFVGPAAQAAIHAALGPHPQVVLHDYAGLDHGFAATSGSRRDEAGAQLADSRTASFFAEHLR